MAVMAAGSQQNTPHKFGSVALVPLLLIWSCQHFYVQAWFIAELHATRSYERIRNKKNRGSDRDKCNQAISDDYPRCYVVNILRSVDSAFIIRAWCDGWKNGEYYVYDDLKEPGFGRE
jgi:hypothetical protein